MTAVISHEGWAWAGPFSKFFHYFRDGESLCGGFTVLAPLFEETDLGASPSPVDCFRCWHHREREIGAAT